MGMWRCRIQTVLMLSSISFELPGRDRPCGMLGLVLGSPVRVSGSILGMSVLWLPVLRLCLCRFPMEVGWLVLLHRL